MSIELEDGAATVAAPAAPAVTTEPAVDQYGFTPEDRAAAAAIFAAPDDPTPASPAETTTTNAAPAPDPATGGVNEELLGLAQVFGADLSKATSNDDATSSLTSIIDIVARAGASGDYSFTGGFPPESTIPDTKTVQPPSDEIILDDEALEGLSPQQVALFKRLAAGTQAAQQAANAVQRRWEEVQEAQRESGRQEVNLRAARFIDGLNSSRYGTDGKRSIVQRMEVDAVNKLAGDIVTGLMKYGAQIPVIETVMRAAVLKYEGKPHFQVAVPPAAPAPVVPLAPRSAGGLAPAVVPKGGVGSTSSGDVYMRDAEYLAGARAILNG